MQKRNTKKFKITQSPFLSLSLSIPLSFSLAPSHSFGRTLFRFLLLHSLLLSVSILFFLLPSQSRDLFFSRLYSILLSLVFILPAHFNSHSLSFSLPLIFSLRFSLSLLAPTLSSIFRYQYLHSHSSPFSLALLLPLTISLIFSVLSLSSAFSLCHFLLLLFPSAPVRIFSRSLRFLLGIRNFFLPCFHSLDLL